MPYGLSAKTVILMATIAQCCFKADNGVAQMADVILLPNLQRISPRGADADI
jgi:hypothetical protein